MAEEAKAALDSVIKKARVHFYKPIQIAEILFYHRTKKKLELTDLESYRSVSKRWRDEVSTLLVGRSSTSSAKYQDNIFEPNAMPPQLLAVLGKINTTSKGGVEAYIYKALQNKLLSVHRVRDYIEQSTVDTFSIMELVELFTSSPGLRRSTDKIYEIAVHALFSAIVRALKAEITLSIKNEDKEILTDFEGFIKMVLGIDARKTQVAMPAALFRVGVTNAADRGLDMWANFGTAIQVKHLTLTPEVTEGIVEGIEADRIVIVCRDAEKKPIEALLQQLGIIERVQGIITLKDLHDWYTLCLSKEYRERLAGTLLSDLTREFDAEFPSSAEIVPFIKERAYTKITLPTGWDIEE
ncbi:MAG TPA: HaeII family restriction endonuclease [Candidatus Paceibacterota bacterium]|nr:HaeII family restriction endonuclease [Candidatus Paceibacterota bacterium]